ncbi:MAG: hypothetical protein ACOC8A_01945 [bacterium]
MIRESTTKPTVTTGCYDDLRYEATVAKLLAEKKGRVRDQIAAEHAAFLAGLPEGDPAGAFPADPKSSYPTLSSTHRLTLLRAQLPAWITRLTSAGR